MKNRHYAQNLFSLDDLQRANIGCTVFFVNRRQVRLVIADDRPIFRDGLKRLLEAEADFKVVGQASDGAEAVQLVRELKPDILLLELAMPRHSGLEALRDLSTPGYVTQVRAIILTSAAERGQIVEALQLGARGIVLKDSSTQLLFKAIRTVMAGEYWVGRVSASSLVQHLRTLVVQYFKKKTKKPKLE